MQHGCVGGVTPAPGHWWRAQAGSGLVPSMVQPVEEAWADTSVSQGHQRLHHPAQVAEHVPHQDLNL